MISGVYEFMIGIMTNTMRLMSYLERNCYAAAGIQDIDHDWFERERDHCPLFVSNHHQASKNFHVHQRV